MKYKDRRKEYYEEEDNIFFLVATLHKRVSDNKFLPPKYDSENSDGQTN